MKHLLSTSDKQMQKEIDAMFNFRPRPFGSLRFASKNTRFTVNGFNNTFWRPRSVLARNWTFRARGKRFLGRGFPKFIRNRRPTVTREELDRELEEYMKKGKHPQIDVSDLK